MECGGPVDAIHTAGWWWRTTARGEAPAVTGLEGEGVRRLCHMVELLWEEEGDEDLTRDWQNWGGGPAWWPVTGELEVAAMTDGKKRTRLMELDGK
jgi:hypothetical protein